MIIDRKTGRDSDDLLKQEINYFEILKNKIDIENVPFSDRSSRLLIFKDAGQSSLHIRVSERWKREEPKLGHYRDRPHFISEMALLDGNGQPMEFQVTTFPHQIVLDTPRGMVKVVFGDAETVYFLLPPARIGMQFKVLANSSATDRRGGTFKGSRNVAYTTNAAILENRIDHPHEEASMVRILVDGSENSALTLNITPRLGYNRQVHPDEVLPAATERWWKWFSAAPTVNETYRRQYYYAWWIMASGLISSRYYLTREAMVPSKVHYVGVWHWDAFFHAIAYRHVDRRLAEDQLRIILDHQLPDGMIPDCVHDEGIVDYLSTPCEGPVTKPPIMAWAALKLYETTRNLDFLQEIYEPITRWNEWWLRQNDDDQDGLAQYNHPFSSGLDDSPLWDEGMPVVSPDLNTYLCLQMESLGKIARLIGEEKQADYWLAKSRRTLGAMLDRLWDEDAGIFRAMKMANGRIDHPVDVLTPFSLFPLWTGRLSSNMARRLVSHLTDPSEFWTPYPVPTVAVDDPQHDPEKMWRGPAWINVNYIMVEALERSGHQSIAHELARRTLEMVNMGPDICEYYNPQTGLKPPKAAPMFGWSAALFIDLAIRLNGIIG